MPTPSVENAIAACQCPTRSPISVEPHSLKRNTSKQLHWDG